MRRPRTPPRRSRLALSALSSRAGVARLASIASLAGLANGAGLASVAGFAGLTSLGCRPQAASDPTADSPSADSPPAANASVASSAPAPSAAPPAPAASTASAPPALDAALPAGLDFARLEPLATCAQRGCVLAPAFLASAKPNASSPVAVWRQRLEGGNATLITPTLHDGALYGLVLEGRATLRAGRAAPSPLEPWDTFYAPRGGVTFGTEGGDATLLLVRVTPPKKGPAHPLPGATAPFEIRRLRDQPDLVWAHGAFRARLAFEGPEHPASFGLLRGAPTAPVAPHQHDDSWEILVNLRTDGAFRIDAETGPRQVTDGHVVVIPPATRHAFEPAGTRPLIGVQLYIPPGPEQRFHKLAADEAAQSPTPAAAPK